MKTRKGCLVLSLCSFLTSALLYTGFYTNIPEKIKDALKQPKQKQYEIRVPNFREPDYNRNRDFYFERKKQEVWVCTGDSQDYESQLC